MDQKQIVLEVEMNGVTIILSPIFSKCYKLSGLLHPPISQNNGVALGRFIGIKLLFTLDISFFCLNRDLL